MLISEIFYSIQGEGILTGTPSVFVRVAGCNLRCNWCDTPYASWNPKGQTMTVDKIMNQVLTYPARHIVITGGEPMIFKEIHELAGALHKEQKHITIETAGTVAPSDIECDLASLSPKLSNSAPDQRFSNNWQERHEKLRIQIDILNEWIKSYDYQLKFVITSEKDIIEIQDLIQKIDYDIPPESVLLMPEGTNPEAIKKHTNIIVELCKKHGYRYCSRLHIDLFGNRKGT